MGRKLVGAVEIVALVIAALTVVSLFRPAPEPEPIPPPPPGAAIDAKALYLDRCAGCHGDFGQGTYAPELRNGLVVAAFPNAQDQVAVVTTGKGTMPAFGGQLTPEQIQAVVDYTRAL